MAEGRTVSATELTDKDRWALEICLGISESLAELISNNEGEKDFRKKYGRVHLSRDAGLGLAGAKLQRDALCTRGRQGKAPYSNRNLRWHPLIIAMENPDYAEEVEEVTIDNRSLVFINFYDVDPLKAYNATLKVFKEHHYNLSPEYPGQTEIEGIMRCPLCLASLNSPPANLNLPDREEVFQPPWRKSKRGEGKAESLQLFYTVPLEESKVHHTPKLVRYGHRWCNVAMADHSVDETVDFMRAVVEAHFRTKE
ncbi:MAG: hypothetical protein J7K81_09925 [Methanophagales archaeon]|nr:hypothetical protein [Methanophagales archaeon]